MHTRTGAADAATLPALLRLQSWLSPAFPIGAYTCSHGLESAIADGTVCNAADTRDWLHAVLVHGSGRNDAIIVGASHAAMTDAREHELLELATLALALSVGAERRRESLSLGVSFRRAAMAWLAASPEAHDARLASLDGDPLHRLGDGDCPLPVVIGALTAAAGLPRLPVVATALQSSVSNLAWIAARLVPLGQSETLALLATLERPVIAVAEHAATATLDDLGGCAVLADIDSLRHEHLVSRVCRT